MIWQIPRRHHSTTQYQAHNLSSVCYLKIYLKPSTYKQYYVVKRRTLNHPSRQWNKTNTCDGYDFNIYIINNDEYNALQKEWLMLFEGICIFGFWEFCKKFFCILMEVNKIMYGNDKDVLFCFLYNSYPESYIHDVTFAVVWNVVTADENKSVNRLSMNWTSTSLPMCLFVHGIICLDPCNIK